jgi:enterochelin esterase-like enzyme
MNRALHSRLTSEKVQHEYLELPGGHKFDVVVEALPRLLLFFARYFEETSK